MNVVLVNPPRVVPARADFPPLGLAMIGAVAQQAGHHVTILDAAAGRVIDAMSLGIPFVSFERQLP